MAKKKHSQPGWLSHRGDHPPANGANTLFTGALAGSDPSLSLLEHELAPGEQLVHARHPALLVYMLAGAGLLQRGHETTAVISGDCFTIPADLGFNLTNKSQTELRLLTINHEQ